MKRPNRRIIGGPEAEERVNVTAKHLRLYWPKFSKDDEGRKARDTTNSMNPQRRNKERNHPSPYA